MEQHCYPFENLPLPYDYNALEPNIDGKTMEIHHDVLLRGYVDRLNELLACQPRLQCMSLEQLLRGQLPAACPDRFRLRFEAGGVYNHRFFFRGMTPGGSNPSRRMEQILCRAFGGMEELMKKHGLPGHVSGLGARFAIYWGYEDREIDTDLRLSQKLFRRDLANAFINGALDNGLYFHSYWNANIPSHCGFSVQHTLEDIDITLEKMDAVMADMKKLL